MAEVVETPLGAGQGATAGKLEEDGIDDAVFIFGRAVGKARHETGDAEGDEQMLGIDVVEGDHGRAGEEIARGDALEAEDVERNALNRFGVLCVYGKCGEEGCEAEGERTCALRSGLPGGRDQGVERHSQRSPVWRTRSGDGALCACLG